VDVVDAERGVEACGLECVERSLTAAGYFTDQIEVRNV
jgi:hypothetical protein